MKEKIHGLISLLLFSGTMIISFISINESSTKTALTYLLIAVISFLIIVYSYCAKCRCHENNCMHIIPGYAVKILPKRKIGKYLFWDYTGLIVSILLIISIPQYWLVKNPLLFILYLLLFIIAITEILSCICKACNNDNCLLCKKSNANKK